MDDVDGPFEIELDEIEREDPEPFGPEQYRISFRVRRELESFVVPVWIEVGSVPTADLIRVAMHDLNGVLAQLTAETAAWRIEGRG